MDGGRRYQDPRTIVRINKSCDQCRSRKVRCIIPEIPGNAGKASACIHCINRNEACQFSPIKRKFIRKEPQLTPPSAGSPVPSGNDLPIDRLLRSEPPGLDILDELDVVKTTNEKTNSSSMSFFSAQRLSSLANRLGSSILTELVQDLEDLLVTRVCAMKETPKIEFKPPRETAKITPSDFLSYTDSYFEKIHPLYPFLDKQEFISHNAECQRNGTSECSKVCSALYHAVLAIGSQYHGGATFEAGSGLSWNLFQSSLGLMPDILAPPYSLIKLQALIAMAIFANNPSGLHLHQNLTYEAAKMAHCLRYHNSSNLELSHLKAFWTVYHLEKVTSFSDNNSSMFADEDIGSQIPFVPDSVFGEYNWFLSGIQLARMTSITYTSLFTLGSSLRPESERLSYVQDIRRRLEEWRLSVPREFRPRESLRASELAMPKTKMIAIHTQYLYYQIAFAVERVALHSDPDGKNQNEEGKWKLMNAARNVIDLLRFVEVEPHVPVFILGIMPLSAIFIIFDFVVLNPGHRETQHNLALLEQASEFFGQVDYASGGLLPGNVISSFTGIARQYILNLQGNNPPLAVSHPEMQQGIQPIWDYAPNIDFSNINLSPASTRPSATEQIAADASFSTPAYTEGELLNYPISENVQVPNTQIGDLKSIFGFVFPDIGGGYCEPLSVGQMLQPSAP